MSCAGQKDLHQALSAPFDCWKTPKHGTSNACSYFTFTRCRQQRAAECDEGACLSDRFGGFFRIEPQGRCVIAGFALACQLPQQGRGFGGQLLGPHEMQTQ